MLAGLDVRGIDEASAGASGGDTEQGQRQGPKEYSANGTIEKIAARSVTLRHGPVAGLGWPAMTMTFATKSPAQLRGFKRGEKVSFRFVQEDKSARISAIKQPSGQQSTSSSKAPNTTGRTPCWTPK